MARLHFLEKTPLTIDQLKEMVPHHADIRFLDYYQLEGIHSVQDLFGGDRFKSCIILLEIAAKPGSPERVGHFIALLRFSNYYEHFDSYGLGVEQEIAITSQYQRPYLRQLFKSVKLVTSTVQLQTFRQDSNTCGRWAIARCLLNHLSLDDFTHLVRSKSISSDDTVTLMTCLLPGSANIPITNTK